MRSDWLLPFVMGWILSPPSPNLDVEVLTPSTSECDHTWDKVFKEVGRLKQGNWTGPDQWDWCPYKRANWDTEADTGHMYAQRKDGLRTRQRGGTYKPRRDASEETKLADTLSLDF